MTAANRDTAWGGTGGGGPPTFPPVASLDDLTLAGDLRIKGGGPWFDVTAFGAVGGDVTADTAATQAALAALPARGGVVYFPPNANDYVCNSGLTIPVGNVVFAGSGGRSSASAAASRIQFTQTSGSCISFGSLAGITFRDLTLYSSSSSFSGKVLDGDKTAGTDTTQITVENVRIDMAVGASATGTGIALNNATTSRILGCTIIGGGIGVRGRILTGNFTNSVTIQDTYFQYQNTAPIQNIGHGCRILNDTFEPTRLGAAVALVQAFPASGVSVNGNWTGDATVAGSWFQLNGNGWTFMGNQLDAGVVAAAVAIENVGTSQGVVIIGNWFNAFTTAIKTTGQTLRWPVILGNNFNGVTNNIDTLATSNSPIYLPNGGLYTAFTTTPTMTTTIPFTLPVFTTATKPAASSVTGGTVIFVSDGGAGAVFQGSTGAAWVNLG